MNCPSCKAPAGDNDYACTGCGTVLRPPSPPAVPASASGFAAMIPTRNKPALIGYYLGVLALIPPIGWFFGIPAFVLGLRGLRLAREHPEVRGGGHAWFAVIAGGLFSVVYLALTAVVLGAFRS